MGIRFLSFLLSLITSGLDLRVRIILSMALLVRLIVSFLICFHLFGEACLTFGRGGVSTFFIVFLITVFRYRLCLFACTTCLLLLGLRINLGFFGHEDAGCVIINFNTSFRGF